MVLIDVILSFLIILRCFFLKGLFITAYQSVVKLKIFKDLIGMKLSKVPLVVIVSKMIAAAKAGIKVNQVKLEAYFLAGGNMVRVINALVFTGKANWGLSFERATAIDLAGKDVLEAVKMSVIPKVIETPVLASTAKEGIQLKARKHLKVVFNA